MQLKCDSGDVIRLAEDIDWYLGAVMQPLLPWKINDYYTLWVCVCRLRYSARNAHASYCHLWPAWLYNIFSHYLINGTLFGGGILNINFVFRFSLQLLSETFFFVERSERDMIMNVHVKYLLLWTDFNKTWILWTCFRKALIWNVMKIHPVKTELFHADGRINGQTDVTNFLNVGAIWGWWITSRLGRFAPGKEPRYPLYMRLGGPQGRSGRM
jgi:hypothetical protein